MHLATEVLTLASLRGYMPLKQWTQIFQIYRLKVVKTPNWQKANKLAIYKE